MTPGELVKLLSLVLRIDEKTFTVSDRLLKEADLLPRGGRGRSARRVTPRDMATLIIAALATDKPARVVDAVARVAAFQMIDPGQDLPYVEKGGLGPDHTFLDVLELVCDPARYDWPKRVEIEFGCEDARLAWLSINGKQLIYMDRADTSQMLDAMATSEEAAIAAAFKLRTFTPHPLVTERRVSGSNIRLLRQVVFAKGGKR